MAFHAGSVPGVAIMNRKPQVVLFDVGNTLLFPNWARILAPLIAIGAAPTAADLQAIERKTKKQFDQDMKEGRGKVDHGFWEIFYGYLLQSLGLRDSQLQQKLTDTTRLSANWDIIRPGTRKILQQIATKYRIGVISNADGRIDVVLTLCGIGDCFSHITDSGIIGHEKPHPAIFAAALKKMNVPAECAMYVGDVYSVDYLGATSAGMQATLFDVSGAYRDDEWPRVESLQELETVLNRAYD
jgi:HAD superfamily hydrolase (TIGR01509 family)